MSRKYPQAKIDALEAALAERDAEIDRLRKLMGGDLATIKLVHDGFDVKHWAVKLLAHSFADSLGDAPNFVVMEIGVPEFPGGPAVSITIQRKHADTPESKYLELAEENRKLREELQEARNAAKNTEFRRGRML